MLFPTMFVFSKIKVFAESTIRYGVTRRGLLYHTAHSYALRNFKNNDILTDLSLLCANINMKKNIHAHKTPNTQSIMCTESSLTEYEVDPSHNHNFTFTF